MTKAGLKNRNLKKRFLFFCGIRTVNLDIIKIHFVFIFPKPCDIVELRMGEKHHE